MRQIELFQQGSMIAYDLQKSEKPKYEGEILTPDEIQELRYAEARKMELDSRVNLFSAK